VTNAGSVDLNEEAPARKTKAQTRQRLRVVNIEPCLLVRNPDRLVRQVDEVKSVWELMCVLHPYLHEFRIHRVLSPEWPNTRQLQTV
jgi:hypothetical protein